ncbi:MAG: hypothetical protein KatS3mg003_1745 [Candidatus Nitrosocaldaceae archaeon]|nr:MAG: hypothetical protein KatS3mg003_1745 [Candidatus Nitrosocaldaceae archaeon]
MNNKKLIEEELKRLIEEVKMLYDKLLNLIPSEIIEDNGKKIKKPLLYDYRNYFDSKKLCEIDALINSLKNNNYVSIVTGIQRNGKQLVSVDLENYKVKHGEGLNIDTVWLVFTKIANYCNIPTLTLTSTSYNQGLHLYYYVEPIPDKRDNRSFEEIGIEIIEHNKHVVAIGRGLQLHNTEIIATITLENWRKFIEIDSQLNDIVKALKPYYKQGVRDLICLSLSGYLRKKGYNIDYTKLIIECLCIIFNDEEKDNRIKQCVEQTYKQDIERVSAYKIAKEVNEKLADKLSDIFNVREEKGTIDEEIIKKVREEQGKAISNIVNICINNKLRYHTKLYMLMLMYYLQYSVLYRYYEEAEKLAECLNNECIYCSKAFNDKYGLFEHVKEEHTNIKCFDEYHQAIIPNIIISDIIYCILREIEDKKGKVIGYAIIPDDIDNLLVAFKYIIENEGRNRPIVTIDGNRTLRYENGRYVIVNDNKIEADVRDLITKSVLANNLHYELEYGINEKYTTKKVKEIIKIIKEGTYDNTIKWNSKYINCRNGLIDLDKLELIEHSPDYFHTIQINANYIADDNELKRRSRKVIDFFKAVMPEQYERSRLLEALALVFLPEYQYALMLIGKGANGKSTLLSFYKHMLGRENVSHVSIHDLEYNRFAVAELDNKIANIFADIKRLELTSTSNLKAIISKDPIKAERKYGQLFTLYPIAYLIFSCNELPEVSEDTLAWFRRWIIIEFKQKFLDNAKVDILEELTKQENLDILFSILIRIAYRIKKNGIRYIEDPESVRIQWVMHSNPLERFIKEVIEVTNNANDRIPKRDLYREYTIWCNKNSIKHILTENQFSRRLKAKGFIDSTQKLGKKATKVWLGVKLLVSGTKDNTVQDKIDNTIQSSNIEIPNINSILYIDNRKYNNIELNSLKDKVVALVNDDKVYVKCLVCNDNYTYQFSLALAEESMLERWYYVFHEPIWHTNKRRVI